MIIRNSCIATIIILYLLVIADQVLQQSVEKMALSDHVCRQLL